MTNEETSRLQKQVAIKATDDDERIATGVVLTPNEVDHQGDFLRPDAIRRFYSEDPDDGVMHARFPDNAASLELNEVLESDRVIDGEAFEAGEWVIRRRYHDDDLWQLVKDDVLGGFSIGGEVTEYKEYQPETVPDDIAFPAGVPKGEGATELINGTVTEISDVDIPAVPSAEHAVVKSLEKNIVEEVDSEDEFIEVMAGRGHSEKDARRLWAFLTDNAMSDETTDKADESTEAEASKELDEEDVGVLKRLANALKFASESPDDGGDALEVSDADATEKEDTMTEEDTEAEKSLPEKNAEAIEELTETVKSLAEDGEEEETEKEADDASEDDLAEKVDALAEKVDEIAKQSGGSQQLGKAEPADEEDELEAQKRRLFGLE